jgi:hypothetical protein
MRLHEIRSFRHLNEKKVRGWEPREWVKPFLLKKGYDILEGDSPTGTGYVPNGEFKWSLKLRPDSYQVWGREINLDMFETPDYRVMQVSYHLDVRPDKDYMGYIRVFKNHVEYDLSGHSIIVHEDHVIIRSNASERPSLYYAENPVEVGKEVAVRLMKRTNIPVPIEVVDDFNVDNEKIGKAIVLKTKTTLNERDFISNSRVRFNLDQHLASHYFRLGVTFVATDDGLMVI